MILMEAGDRLSPRILETHLRGLVSGYAGQLPGRILPHHTHLPISTLSGLVSLFYLGEYYLCLLLCGQSRKFENQLFYIKQFQAEFR